MLLVAPGHGVGVFDEDSGFDSGQGSGGSLEEPVGLDDLVEEVCFEIVFG